MNNVEDLINIEHAIVGKIVDLNTSPGNAKIVSPSKLTCDVLELDCEGAEINIIKNLDDLPSTIIVETHPGKGAKTQCVKNGLENRGYEILETRDDRSDGDVLAAKHVE